MTSSRSSAFDFRHPWFIGGALLLTTVVLDLGLHPVGGPIAGGVLTVVIFAAALLVFALGIRGTGSVTARRPLGTVALILLAAWILVELVVTDVISSGMSGDAIPQSLLVLGYVDPFLRFALTLIAVIQIGRTGIVPRPWNWAPAWALGALTVPWLLGQALIVVGIPPEAQTAAFLAVGAVDGTVRATCAVVIGVLAILLADRSSSAQPDPLRATPAE
ncbi:MAG: hypothetical protein ABWX65_07370, partial [Mycetocola sp.]